MANATRSRGLSPVVLGKRRLDSVKFQEAWHYAAKRGLGVKYVAYSLNWHLDDVVYMARETNKMLAIVGKCLPEM